MKKGTPDTASLEGEAAALRWLAEAMPNGGIPIAEVVSVSPFELTEKRVVAAAPSKQAAERAGAALAIMHAAGAPWWGAPPTGWQGAYRIADSLTPTVSEEDAPSTWGAFFAQWRVLSYAEQARDVGVLTRDEVAIVERVADRLKEGIYDAPQPVMLQANGMQVARIHGDLWSGNLLWDADSSNGVGAILIDPMAHGGHAETDLAMLALFGCPYLERIIAAYNEVSPLADGWRERVRLHQLAPLLHHCALFGRSYVPETLAAARKFA